MNDTHTRLLSKHKVVSWDDAHEVHLPSEIFHFPPISLLLRSFILPFLQSQDRHLFLNVTSNCPSVCVRSEILHRGSPAAQITGIWS